MDSICRDEDGDGRRDIISTTQTISNIQNARWHHLHHRNKTTNIVKRNLQKKDQSLAVSKQYTTRRIIDLQNRKSTEEAQILQSATCTKNEGHEDVGSCQQETRFPVFGRNNDTKAHKHAL